MLQLHQVGVDLHPDWLFVVFNGGAEDELEEVVEHEWPFKLVGFAEIEKVQRLDCALTKSACVFLLISFLALQERKKFVEGKSACRQPITLIFLILLKF